MDILYNEDVRFTRWALHNGLLREPLVVFDVGVLGGEHPRWNAYGNLSHGLNDVAIDIAQRCRSELVPGMDVDEAVRLLANVNCRLNDPIIRMEKSLSWKVTAPLRAGRRMLRHFLSSAR